MVVGEGGERRRFRLAVSAVPDGPTPALRGGDAPPLRQVVLTDVTDEERRRQQAERFAERVLAAQEEERRRLAQELHDGPLQALVHLARQLADGSCGDAPAAAVGAGPMGGAGARAETIGAGAGVATAGVAMTGAEAIGGGTPGASLTEPRQLALQVVAELRRIARGLRPSVLDDLGLVAALRRLVEDAADRGRSVDLVVMGPQRRLPPDVELALFRVGQQALANAEQHADAHSVTVTLAFEQGRVRLLVSDDGQGWDPTVDGSEERPGGLGLPGMAERLRLVGGRLALTSAPGQGTVVEALVPVGPPGRHPPPGASPR